MCAFEEVKLSLKSLPLLVEPPLAAILIAPEYPCAFDEAGNSKRVLLSLKVCAFTSQSVCFHVAWQPANVYSYCVSGVLKDDNYKEKYLPNKELASRAFLFYGT